MKESSDHRSVMPSAKAPAWTMPRLRACGNCLLSMPDRQQNIEEHTHTHTHTHGHQTMTLSVSVCKTCFYLSHRVDQTLLPLPMHSFVAQIQNMIHTWPHMFWSPHRDGLWRCQRNQTWRRGRVQRSLRALVRSTSRLQSARRCFELSNASNHSNHQTSFSDLFCLCFKASCPRKGGRLNSAPVTLWPKLQFGDQNCGNQQLPSFQPWCWGGGPWSKLSWASSTLTPCRPYRTARHKGMTLVVPLARCYCSSTRLRRT